MKIGLLKKNTDFLQKIGLAGTLCSGRPGHQVLLRTGTPEPAGDGTFLARPKFAGAGDSQIPISA